MFKSAVKDHIRVLMTAKDEEDNPRPLNADGITKLAGDRFVHATTARHSVIRTSGLYKQKLVPCQGRPEFHKTHAEFTRERREVRVVDSEVVTPTSTVELARKWSS